MPLNEMRGNEFRGRETGMRRQVADVSVLIPTYNCGKYIGQAIESVLCQTVPVREILVIDDGSSDNTSEIVKRFDSTNRLRYIQKENTGQAHTRKVGAQMAESDYIAFLDADDIWEPSKIERQMQALENPDTHLCFTDISAIDAEGNPAIYERRKSQVLRRGNVLQYIFINNFVSHSSLVVEKKFLERIGSFDAALRMGDDWDIVLRLATCCAFEFVPEKLVRYRIRGNQLSKNFDLRIEDQDRIVEKFMREYPGYLSVKQIRRGNAFRARTRGYHYAPSDVRKSLTHYGSAIKNEPLNGANYKGVLRSIYFFAISGLRGNGGSRKSLQVKQSV